MAAVPVDKVALPAPQRELVKISFKYGGPNNDEEEWFRGLPSLLPFPENPYLEKWESMKINFDLIESKKRLNISDGRPITTHVPYEAVTAYGGFSKENIYDSGSRFKLPQPRPSDGKKSEGLFDFARSHRATSANVWGKIIGQFNVGGLLFDNTNGKYAPRLVLPQFQYNGSSSTGTDPGPATPTTPAVDVTTSGPSAEPSSTPATGESSAGPASTPATGGSPAGPASTPATGGSSAGPASTPATGGSLIGPASTPAVGGPPGTPATPETTTTTKPTPETAKKLQELIAGVAAGTTDPSAVGAFVKANEAFFGPSSSPTPPATLKKFDATRKAALSGDAAESEKKRSKAPIPAPRPSSAPAAEASVPVFSSGSSALKRKHRPTRVLDPTYRPVPLSPATRRLDEEIPEEEIFEEETFEEETPIKRPKISKTIRPRGSSAEAGPSRLAISRARARSTTPRSGSSRVTGAGEGSSAVRPSSVRKGKAKKRGPVQFADPYE